MILFVIIIIIVLTCGFYLVPPSIYPSLSYIFNASLKYSVGSLLDICVLIVFVWICLSLIWGNLSSSLFKFSFKICFFYFMSVLPASLYVHVCTRCPQRSEEGIKFPGTDVLNGWKSPCGYRELDLLREQQVLLITGISPQTIFYDFVKGLVCTNDLGFFSFIHVYNLKV